MVRVSKLLGIQLRVISSILPDCMLRWLRLRNLSVAKLSPVIWMLSCETQKNMFNEHRMGT